MKLLVTANVSRSFILSTMMMEAVRSSETSSFTRDTLCHIPEDGFLLGTLYFSVVLLLKLRNITMNLKQNAQGIEVRTSGLAARKSDH
jgi:hypothetical protein